MRLADLLSMRGEIVAAFLSAIATAFAAYAAIAGPKRAAELAEKIRHENEGKTERRRIKLHIFATIMQERAQFHSIDAVRAFNLIDVAFKDNLKVRDAWAEFYNSLDQRSGIEKPAKDRLLRLLLEQMAIDLNISDGLRLDDFGRVYFPQAMEDEERIRLMERRAALQRLQGTTQPSTNITPAATTPNLSMFPPKPD